LGVIERFNHTLKQIIKHANDIALTRTSFVHFSDGPAVRWNAHTIVSADYNKSNDEVVSHKVCADAFVETHDYPDLKPEIKKALHNEERTIGRTKILQRFKLSNAYEVYKIQLIYIVPKSQPPVYLYQLSSILRSSKDKIVHFDKFILQQKINPIK